MNTGWSVQRCVDDLLNVSTKASEDAVQINKLLVDRRFGRVSSSHVAAIVGRHFSQPDEWEFEVMSLFRALNAEVLKLKRTLAFRVIFVLAAADCGAPVLRDLANEEIRARIQSVGRRIRRTRFRSGPCS